MEDWIMLTVNYFLSNWWGLLVGGLVVVGVVMFLMGSLKVTLIKKIKNALLRKVILAWSSVILTLPVTAIVTCYNGFNFAHFWSIYVVNCIGVILIYWFYENTAFRDGLTLVGRKVVTKILFGSTDIKDLEKTVKAANEDVESLLNNSSSNSKSKYKDDDLKNL